MVAMSSDVEGIGSGVFLQMYHLEGSVIKNIWADSFLDYYAPDSPDELQIIGLSDVQWKGNNKLNYKYQVFGKDLKVVDEEDAQVKYKKGTWVKSTELPYPKAKAGITH